jgi:ABC-2 type transport system permease protein
MRLLSEEKRTGTLEFLLTAPVKEFVVVLSKFVATMFFFMLLLIPSVLFLVALRLEGGKPFDHRPLLSFLLALVSSSAAFVAMGLFFSSTTRNQLIAAVLTFMGLMILIFITILNDQSGAAPEGTLMRDIHPVLRTMSFYDMWDEARQGKVYLRDVSFHISAAVFWLFLSIKVLEARRWS